MDKTTAALSLIGIFALAAVLASVISPTLGYEATGGVVVAIVVGGAVWLARRMRSARRTR